MLDHRFSVAPMMNWTDNAEVDTTFHKSTKI
jgi:hypothetical protein